MTNRKSPRLQVSNVVLTTSGGQMVVEDTRREDHGHEVVFRSHLPFTFLGPGLSRTRKYEKVAFSQRQGLQLLEVRTQYV